MSESSDAIELIDVDVTHDDAPDRVLIRRVNWRIGRGEFWCVGGDQDSGKTSLLATAVGLNRPASGTLRIFGRDLAEATESEQVDWRRRIGFVYENSGRAFSNLTVAENVALPIQYHLDLDEQKVASRVRELLTMAELGPYALVRPSRLNSRIQQRVGLMRALAVPTEVLFLDNPLAGLSPREARWWLGFLGDLRAKQAKENPVTIVVACGDFRGWLDVADHFAVIQGNEFRVIGGREQLAGIQEPAVRELLSNGI